MRVLEPDVVDAVWAAVEPHVPAAPVGDPRRGHRPRVPDRMCFWGILVRLATGCSWQPAEALLGRQVSDTTLRSRRDEWIAAGVFELIAAYDRIVGLDLDDVCIAGSTHKAPCGREGTGKSPVDRRKSGWKRSIAVDGAGIPVGWAAAAAGICDLARPPKRKPSHDGPAGPVTAPLGLRWRVERTNSWLSNYGQLRRNTDRKPEHRDPHSCWMSSAGVENDYVHLLVASFLSSATQCRFDAGIAGRRWRGSPTRGGRLRLQRRQLRPQRDVHRCRIRRRR